MLTVEGSKPCVISGVRTAPLQSLVDVLVSVSGQDQQNQTKPNHATKTCISNLSGFRTQFLESERSFMSQKGVSRIRKPFQQSVNCFMTQKAILRASKLFQESERCFKT